MSGAATASDIRDDTRTCCARHRPRPAERVAHCTVCDFRTATPPAAASFGAFCGPCALLVSVVSVPPLARLISRFIGEDNYGRPVQLACLERTLREALLGEDEDEDDADDSRGPHWTAADGTEGDSRVAQAASLADRRTIGVAECLSAVVEHPEFPVERCASVLLVLGDWQAEQRGGWPISADNLNQQQRRQWDRLLACGLPIEVDDGTAADADGAESSAVNRVRLCLVQVETQAVDLPSSSPACAGRVLVSEIGWPPRAAAADLTAEDDRAAQLLPAELAWPPPPETDEPPLERDSVFAEWSGRAPTHRLVFADIVTDSSAADPLARNFLYSRFTGDCFPDEAEDLTESSAALTASTATGVCSSPDSAYVLCGPRDALRRGQFASLLRLDNAGVQCETYLSRACVCVELRLRRPLEPTTPVTVADAAARLRVAEQLYVHALGQPLLHPYSYGASTEPHSVGFLQCAAHTDLLRVARRLRQLDPHARLPEAVAAALLR